MKSIIRTCETCKKIVSEIPLLTCGHFICSDCYVKIKNNKCSECPICLKHLKRNVRAY